MKHPLPNIFYCTAFKKHHGFLLDENQKKADFSKMFLYLPSTLDRKEDFLQWKEHVHLHPIDASYDDLKALNDDEDVNPALLDHKELRTDVIGGYYKMMKKVAEISNQNLVRNSDAYISNGGKIDRDNEFSWIDDSYKQGKKNPIGLLILGSSFNIWLRLHEELQFKLLSYLNANDLIILCYVSNILEN